MKPIAIFLLIALITAVLLWRTQSNWSHYTTSQIHQITHKPLQTQRFVDLKETRSLPPIVQKYFHLVLKDGTPIIQKVHLIQNGGFRPKPELTSWSKMTAEQFFSTQPAAFVWLAQIEMFPGINIHVMDAYLNGKGQMKGALMRWLPMIDAQNRPELSEGALQRYLAEVVWFPTALLPSQGVTWSALTPLTAKATFSHGGITTSLEFEFNSSGEIISVFTPSRYREVSGNYLPTPWKGHFSHYIKIQDYLIPQTGEVSWLLKDQVYAYWQATLGAVHYE